MPSGLRLVFYFDDDGVELHAHVVFGFGERDDGGLRHPGAVLGRLAPGQLVDRFGELLDGDRGGEVGVDGGDVAQLVVIDGEREIDAAGGAFKCAQAERAVRAVFLAGAVAQQLGDADVRRADQRKQHVQMHGVAVLRGERLHGGVGRLAAVVFAAAAQGGAEQKRAQQETQKTVHLFLLLPRAVGGAALKWARARGGARPAEDLCRSRRGAADRRSFCPRDFAKAAAGARQSLQPGCAGPPSAAPGRR